MEDFNDFGNPQVAKLPKHLKQFIVEQCYENYTPVDHAVWRYVMRQNYSYLKDAAYYPYIPGLMAAGLTIEEIPNLQSMNDALAKIGWGAVTVDGFIPPAAFMEYQAYRVLVIAADIRQLNHIEYTPAPDIIHESAGHAPIIADVDYQKYLSDFGYIGSKAIFSSRDFDLYETIRTLSILKEMPDADPKDISDAENRIAFCQNNLGEPSEMALLSRLHWWTVEYGLIGTIENHKIYGAGLLSSIGESVSCMTPKVKKIVYDIDAVNYAFDITKPQPQLFVSPDIKNLMKVLEQFADSMAFRTGGMEALSKAIESKNVCTAVYSSGLQVSGVFVGTAINDPKNLNFLKTSGPTALAFDNKQLSGHDKNYHKDGFSSPVGKLKNQELPLENFNEIQLKKIGVEKGKTVTLYFENGIIVNGTVENTIRTNDKLILISFTNCSVRMENAGGEHTILFDPSWGTYDMAVGEKIVSVHCGAADKEAFEDCIWISKTATHHPQYDEPTKAYHDLFKTVRNCRENNSGYEDLTKVWKSLKENFQDDWLCALEILEILEEKDPGTETSRDIRSSLEKKKNKKPEFSKLITDGLCLLKLPV